MKLIGVLFLQAVILYTNAQTKPARLIVRGDDMGYSHSGNLALMKCQKEGIQTSIEIIVPSPWFPEAVKMLKQDPAIDVGIHLALTSEWDNVKWRPVSDCKSITDSNGYFFPMVWPNKNYPGQAILDNPWKIEDVEKEFRAQIELALKHLPWISHVSAHMGCANMNDEVRALTQKLVAEYKIPVSINRNNVIGISYDGPHKTSAEKIVAFTKMLNKLEPGKTYMFVDHPGLNDEELRAIHHIGYENVAEDRQGVTDVFTNEKIKALIKQKGIQLISHKDLVEPRK